MREAAGRLQECAGQEVLDLVESIVTGGYETAVQGAEWEHLMRWSSLKFQAVRDCVLGSSEMPLSLRKLSDFDRALAVQDYQEHLASFSLVGLGFSYTSHGSTWQIHAYSFMLISCYIILYYYCFI